jgi:protein gp37
MNKTAISWTTVTWNPTHGCSRVSEGCRHCYAERLSLQKGFTTLPWTAPNAAQNVLLKPHKLRDPLKLKEPSRIFVNSMSDLFHPLIPHDYRSQIFAVMNATPQHTYQILTKRPEHAACWPGPWTNNIWMGTSIEDRKSLARLDVLRECPAQIRFISFEPLLESLYGYDLTGYHWAIVGGESGPGYRPMNHLWARAIKDQCVKAGVAFFFKQSAAPRTEIGTSLQDWDGTFATWHQFPGQLTPAVPAEPHRYTCPRAA